MARPVKHREGDLCEECGIYPKRTKGYSLAGTKLYGATCTNCHKRPWTGHKLDHCELCDHKPLFARTLVIHHRDGDKTNNSEENLLTLCPNCHGDLHGAIDDLGDFEKAESWLKKLIDRLR